ncbi:MAG: fructosamine kinase family protein [Propionibacteriaceae bacterium]|nr:fructosamine kinase family protein [Propionibacteriaceae bacterium]
MTDTSITLEKISVVAPSRAASRRFGEMLANTHNAGADAFGQRPLDHAGPCYIGNLELPMPVVVAGTLPPRGIRTADMLAVDGTCPDLASPLEVTGSQPVSAWHWGEFYADYRVLPYVRQALERGALSPDDARVLDRLTQRLRAGIYDDDAPPARIHGDLWAGNVLYTSSEAVLIDPAAHGGHRITDLAMLALFGAAHLAETFDAYAATSSQLPKGWRRLIALHQLHPLLVHAVLFGGSYGAAAVRAAHEYR